MDVAPSLEVLADEREADSGQVRAAARAGEQVVGEPLAGRLQLGEGLQADDGLVQGDVVEHAAQGVAGVRILGGLLDRLADGHAQ